MAAIVVTKTNLVKAACTTMDFNGASLGPTDESGVSLKIQSSYEDWFVDQAFGAVDTDLIERTCSVEMILQEATLENLRIAIGLPAAAYSGSYLTVNNTQAPSATLFFAGVGPNSKTRSVICHNVMSVANVDHAMGKKKKTELAVNFKCLWDSVNNDYLKICDA